MVQLTGGVEADLANTGTPVWTDELNGFWTKIGDRLVIPGTRAAKAQPKDAAKLAQGTPERRGLDFHGFRFRLQRWTPRA
jgi:hypothetical protein